MKDYKEFLKQFRFDPERNLMIGIERECHFKNRKGKIVPLAVKVLNYLGSQGGHFGYELSACQLEWRIGPCFLSELKGKLMEDETTLKKTGEKLGFACSFDEVAPEDMPLDVYPDSTRRFQRMVKNLPRRVLLAACQVIATHVHIGMPGYQTALKAYNSVINRLNELCRLGDHSDGRRLEVYRMMASNCIPPHYNSWQDFYDLSVKDGFTEDPRSCWHLIRISIHGTIEFRMFGATDNLEEIVSWATLCRELCEKAEN